MSIVFVIGAGASCEYGLPSGGSLKEKIATLLNFDDLGSTTEEVLYENEKSNSLEVLLALKDYCRLQDDFSESEAKLQCEDAVRRIRKAMPIAPSIDTYISSQSGNGAVEVCGKIAIVSLILQAERESKLSGSELSYEEVRDTWISCFWQSFLGDCTLDELSDRLSKVTLIIFNYDRCAEYNLYRLVQDYHSDCNASRAAELVSQIEIYHPYGTVGSLFNSSSIPIQRFGDSPKHNQLLFLSREIKTYTENVEPPTDEIINLRESVQQAEKVVFLGFGFHQQNLDLLFKNNAPSQQPVTYATTFGLSDSNRTAILRKLEKMGLGGHVSQEGLGWHERFLPKKCHQLLWDVRLSLFS